MRLTPDEFEATAAKLARLNERAAKRGWTGRIEVTGTPVTETFTNPAGFQLHRTFIDAEITGTPPCYQGWTFAAELDWHTADSLIVNAAPGAPEINRETLREGECDHCHTRRHRKSVYLVINAETGQQLQVGSTCIKDFLGWDTAPVWIAPDDAGFDEGFGAGGAGAGGQGQADVAPLDVLAAAWGCIQVFGYHKADEGNATKHAVAAILFPYGDRDRRLAAKVAPYFAKSYEQARIILGWLVSDKFGGPGDYVTNLKVLAKSDRVGARAFGYLASAPVAWAREAEHELRRQARAAEAAGLVNEHFGEIKERLIITAKIRSIRELDGDFGVSTMYTLVTSTGHIAKWRASHAVLGVTADDTVYVLKATVKAHDEWQGAAETVITRCVVLADSRSLAEPEPEPGQVAPFERWAKLNWGYVVGDPDNGLPASPEMAARQRAGYESYVKNAQVQVQRNHDAWAARRAAWAEYGEGESR